MRPSSDHRNELCCWSDCSCFIQPSNYLNLSGSDLRANTRVSQFDVRENETTQPTVRAPTFEVVKLLICCGASNEVVWNIRKRTPNGCGGNIIDRYLIRLVDRAYSMITLLSQVHGRKLHAAAKRHCLRKMPRCCHLFQSDVQLSAALLFGNQPNETQIISVSPS